MMRAQGPKIYTLAARLSKNGTAGQDLAQETFIKAYEHWDKFRGESDVSTWLYRICVNGWKNRVRYEKRRSFWKHFSLDDRDEDSDEPERQLDSGEVPIDQTIQKSDELRALHVVLKKMKPDDRAILVLFEMEERSYEEIAQLLDVPMGTVRSRLARSRDKLRQLLENEMKKPL